MKSDEWKSLRKEAIWKYGFRCSLCKVRPKKKGGSIIGAFQVHHVKYKRLHDVEAGDLKTLCPDCHMAVHALMKKYPKMKKLPRKIQWQTVVYHLRPESRQTLAGQIKGIDSSGQECSQKKERISIVIQPNKSAVKTFFGSSFADLFGATKKNLFDRGLICKNRMKWRDEYALNKILVRTLSSPDEFLQAYIYETKQDPRRLIPVLYNPSGLSP